jgi:hypothetical protein
VIVIVVVILVVIGLICGALLRSGTARRGQARREAERLQADWLAESGLERAAARLADDADYRGETWEIPPEALGGARGAVVRIDVEPVADRPSQRRVEVRADYPRDAEFVARRSKQITMGIRSGQTGGGDR